jgi:hypothetical protein
MVDPQIMEVGKAVNESILSVFFKIILPIMIIGGVLDVLKTLIFKKKLPKWRGRVGEHFVTRKLRVLDEPDYKLDLIHYKILTDLMLPSRGNTSETQIDQVIVSNYGIFCIETKAYQGWIFGNANQDYWTQVIFRYKKRFYNPLRQNFAHVKAIEDLLGPNRLKAPIISLAAFPYADKLKISGTNSVGYTHDIVRKIESYKNIIYSDVERDAIFDLLNSANIIDKEVSKQHDKEIRELKEAKQTEVKLKKLR